jgi:RNA polymerase sigma-70 factor (ECF subfamily)
MTPQQLEQLILTHQRSLELFASQWTTSPEDCVQEAFLRLHRQKKHIANEAAWLFRVVRNLAIDQGRSDASRSNREQFVGRQRSLFASSNSQLIATDELEHAIRQLPDSEREVIVARVWGKLTLNEISESFGIAISTAHRRYNQGILSLQSHFEISCQKPNNR